MAPARKWDSQETFEFHLYDYMMRNNMQRSAAIFKREAGLKFENAQVLDYPPEGFLKVWFRVFSDMHPDLFTTKPSSHASGPPYSSSQEVTSSAQETMGQTSKKQIQKK